MSAFTNNTIILKIKGMRFVFVVVVAVVLLMGYKCEKVPPTEQEKLPLGEGGQCSTHPTVYYRRRTTLRSLLGVCISLLTQSPTR